jgi:hypothetical protein
MRAFGGLCYALSALSGLAALAGVVVGPDWIERLTGAAPDGGDGSLELAWVVVPILLAAFAAVAGRRLRTRAAQNVPYRS